MAPESEVAPLTIDDVRSIFVDVRSHYADKDDDVDLGQICRNMMVTRVADFCKRLSRCEVRPSDRHGEGLFVTRDVDAGELITFFPGDALLFWASGDRKGDLMVYFGAHVPQSERDASEIVSTRAREYELYISAELSAVGDPARRDDPAYLGHFANDAARCERADEAASYEARASSCANAERVLLENMHFALRALRPIRCGEEVLCRYGAGYWLSRSGQPGAVGEELKRVGRAAQPNQTLKQALAASRAPKRARAPAEAQRSRKHERRRAAKQTARRPAARGFGARSGDA